MRDQNCRYYLIGRRGRPEDEPLREAPPADRRLPSATVSVGSSSEEEEREKTSKHRSTASAATSFGSHVDVVWHHANAMCSARQSICDRPHSASQTPLLYIAGTITYSHMDGAPLMCFFLVRGG